MQSHRKDELVVAQNSKFSEFMFSNSMPSYESPPPPPPSSSYHSHNHNHQIPSLTQQPQPYDFPVSSIPASSLLHYATSESTSLFPDGDRPLWTKQGTKIYVVVYPSDSASTFFQVDASKPKVYSSGVGYGIFVEPKKVSRVRFWTRRKSSSSSRSASGTSTSLSSTSNSPPSRSSSSSSILPSQPTLFTIDGGGPAPGLTQRHGIKWGINGMFVRFLIDSRGREEENCNMRRVAEVKTVLDRVVDDQKFKAGDKHWLRAALVALVQANLARREVDVDEFMGIVEGVVPEQMGRGARWDHVLTIDYEDHIAGEGKCRPK